MAKKVKLSVDEITEKVKDLLENVKTLSESTLEEIDQEVRNTSTCILVDVDELKTLAKEISLYRGEVGSFFEDVSGKNHDVKTTLRTFVKESISLARDCERLPEFISDARRLANMLQRAANRIERESP